MAAHAHAAAARSADVSRRERHVHERAVGAVVVVAPDQTLLVGEHRPPPRAALLSAARSIRPIGESDLTVKPVICAASSRLVLLAADGLVEILGRGGDEGLVGPALVRDVGEPGVEQREVGARVDGKVHHAVLAGFDLTGVDGDGAARVDDDDARRFDRLGTELRSFLVHRSAAQIRHPMVQEIIGLGFERVGADRHDRVGELGVLVAVVQFADAHVAGRVDLGVVGRAVVDADVLHLHGPEIELAGAPGVLVAAAGAAVIEGRDEQSVLAHVVDDRDGDARDEIERVIPARRLHLAVAPHHRIGEALQLRVARARVAHLGHASAAHRAKAEFTTHSLSGLMTM